MSSKFLTFIFIILVSVQLSCGWNLWGSDIKDELSTKKTTDKNLKDDELNSSPTAPIEADDDGWPQPLNSAVIDNEDLVNEDEPSSENSDQSIKMTLENVSKMPNEEFDEESSKSPNSEKDIKSIPATSTNSTNPIVNLLFSVSTQIPDNSTLATEKSESESSTTANTTTPTTTENTLNSIDDVNNVPRNVDEDRGGSKDTSSVVSSSTISSSLENSSFENEEVSSSSEFISPEVTYAPNDKNISSWNDEEKEPTSDNQEIGRKDKETHSSRNVTDEPDYSTQKITTENYESGNSSTDMKNTPTTTENMLNSNSNNEARDVTDDKENSGNSSKSETVSDLDPSASMQANTTIETILSTSTATMNTTEMAGSMSNGTTPEVNFGSFVNSGSTGNTNSQLILNLCILIFSISVIV